MGTSAEDQIFKEATVLKLTNSGRVSKLQFPIIPPTDPTIRDHYEALDHDTSGALQTLYENISDVAGAPTYWRACRTH